MSLITQTKKVWEEALWYIENADITEIEKDKYNTEIKQKLNRLSDI